jgi:hypothetical protein
VSLRVGRYKGTANDSRVFLNAVGNVINKFPWAPEGILNAKFALIFLAIYLHTEMVINAYI